MYCWRKAESDGKRGEIRRLGLGGAKEPGIAAVRGGQKAAAPGEISSGELRGRVNVVALVPAPIRDQRDSGVSAARRRRMHAELT